MSTDPTDLAREVLDLAHEDETVTVCSIPDNKATALARAVIAVAATGTVTASPYADGLEEAAARIRATLSGGTR